MSERYEIQEKIGQGGIGAVYRAYDTQLKRSVAIKRMLPSEQEANGPSSVEMMLKEATTLSALQHPNIITVYDVGIDDDGPFVVMELLKGETLDLVIQRGVLTMRDFGEVVSQTMEALIAAEAAGVLHRDLKPTNVMVNWLPSKKFQVKILDFSLAKFSRTPAPQTIDQGDAIFGSIYFMAPEQFERGNLDKRTDLYSMGCLYYFCLSGQYPFQGDSAAQVMASHLQGTVVPLEQIRSDLPPVICQWVMWLINRYADDRPQDSKEAFENYQNLTAAIDPSTNRVPLSGQHSATPLNSNSRRLIVPPPRHTTSVNRLPTGTVSAETGAIEEGLEDSVATGAVTVMPRKETNLLTYLAIGLAVLVIVAAGLFAMFLVQKRSQDNAVKLLESFQSSDAPLGSAEDVPGLAGFLDGGVSDGIALTARTALTELKDVTGSPTAINVAVVKELEKARNPYVQVNLIKVIQERKISSAAAESLLLEMTSSDQDPAVMREVMTALAALGDKQTFIALLGNVRGESKANLPVGLDGALVNIGDRISADDKTEVASELAGVLAQKSGNIRYPLIRVLGSLGGEEALLMIEGALLGEDKGERRLALEALAKWPERTARVANLAELAFKDSERTKALEAYIELLFRPGTEPTVATMVDMLIGQLLVDDRSLDNLRTGFLDRLHLLEDRKLGIKLADQMLGSRVLADNIKKHAQRVYDQLSADVPTEP